MTRAVIHTALWWPIWWAYEWVLGRGLAPVGTTMMKFLFYANNFLMAIFWFLAYSIAKRTEPGRREVAKYIIFWLAVHVLIEIHLLMDQVKWPI